MMLHVLWQGAGLLAAAAESDGDTMGIALLIRHLIAAAIFSVTGVAVLFFCIWVFDRLSPYSFRKEIVEDQNTALGIIVAALLLGISLIIAAAIQG